MKTDIPTVACIDNSSSCSRLLTCLPFHRFRPKNRPTCARCRPCDRTLPAACTPDIRPERITNAMIIRDTIIRATPLNPNDFKNRLSPGNESTTMTMTRFLPRSVRDLRSNEIRSSFRNLVFCNTKTAQLQ